MEENITVAKAIADTLKTTLGPKGMDKMLIDAVGDIVITNDGATVLKEVELKHPGAKVIAEVAKTLEESVGDGTASAVVLTGELLNKALELKKKGLHPATIIKGYELARDYALDALDRNAISIDVNDKKVLENIIGTALTGKSVGKVKEILTRIVLETAQTVESFDDVKIEKKIGGSIEDSKVIKGVLIDKEPVFSQMSKKIDKARIVLVDSPLEVKTLETNAEIKIRFPEELGKFREKELEMLKDLVQKIINVNANLVLCQKGIDEEAQQMLAKAGITAIRRIRRTDMELLSKALRVNIVTDLKDLKESDVGLASMETKKIGDEEMTIIHNCANPKAVTILLRGAQEQLLDEIERSIKDAFGDLKTIFKDNRVVFGAGATELMLRKKIIEYSNKIKGKEQLAVLGFAQALEAIPKALIENSGGNVIDIMAELIKRYESCSEWGAGERVINAKKEGIIEPLNLKKQVIKTACESAKMVLRVDNIILKKKL